MVSPNSGKTSRVEHFAHLCGACEISSSFTNAPSDIRTNYLPLIDAPL